MICPRCTVAEIADSGHCALCGFSPSTGVILQQSVIDEVRQVVEESTAHRFRIEALLRLGERSLVYLAHEVGQDRLVALKVIPVQGGVPRPLAQAFERQAALYRSLRQAHIVTLHDFGVTATFLWYTLDHVPGQSLGDLLRESGPLSLEVCLNFADQIASALDHAHRRGVPHGNLKPSNVFLDDRWVRVADFAILDAFGRRAASGSAAAPSLRLPEYMAPEQFYARTPVASADQYALAVITYQCLTGTLPFIGDSFEEVARRQAQEVAPPLSQSRKDLPVTVSQAVQRALSKQPAGRFPSVLDFVTALGAPSPPPARSFAPARRSTPAPRTSHAPPVLVIEPEAPSRIPRRTVVLLAALAITAGAAFGFRDRIAALWRADLPLQDEAPMVVSTTPVPAPVPAPGGAEADERAGGPGGVAETAGAAAPAGLTGRRSAAPAPPAAAAVPKASAVPVRPATLLINTTPWGQLSVDGVLIGNTPKADVPLSPGRHLIRVTREGYEPFEREVLVESGQVVRLTGIVLVPRSS